MTMTIEEKFNNDVWRLIEILQTKLIVSDGEDIQFNYTAEKETASNEKLVIEWFIRLGVIKIKERIYSKADSLFMYNPFIDSQPIGYRFEVDTTKFNTARKIYEQGMKEKKDPQIIINDVKRLSTSIKAGENSALKEIKREKFELYYDKKSHTLIYKDKRCEVPVGSNQLILCEHLFKVKPSEWVTETDVVDDFRRGKESKQGFYDACGALDERITEALGISDLIEYQMSKARLNPVTFKKLTGSEK